MSLDAMTRIFFRLNRDHIGDGLTQTFKNLKSLVPIA